MFNFFKTTETKKIEILFKCYKDLLDNGISDEEARIELIGELRMRNGFLKEQFKDWNNEAKKKEIQKLFSPLEIIKYDVFKLIAFMVVWEFPKKYNYMPTIKKIRSGRHNQAYLEEKVKKTGKQFLS
jgi:hypothetical protein